MSAVDPGLIRYQLRFGKVLHDASSQGCNVARRNVTASNINRLRKKEKTRKPVAVQAFPSNAGVCNLPATGNCMAANTCSSGGSCTIGVANNSSETVDLTLNGTALSNPNQIVCIPSAGSITWNVAASNSSFLADFGNAAPFTDNNNLTYFGGTTAQPATHTAATANGLLQIQRQGMSHSRRGRADFPELRSERPEGNRRQRRIKRTEVRVAIEAR